MYKVVLFLAMMGSAWAVKSDVAFTSYTEMMGNEPTILENVIVKNTEPTETTADCKYIKEWKAKYPFTTSKKHEHIFYYVWQCLDDSMAVIRSNVTFNYDGDDANMHELPEGCVPPTPTAPPTNPCQNGFALGEEVVETVSKMLTKKLVDHPKGNEEIPEFYKGVVDTDDLETVTEKFPELEDALEKVIEDVHDSNPENTKPDEVTENPDGTITKTYKFPNGDEAETTESPEGTETVLKKPDGSKVVTKEKPEEPTTVEVFDKDGVLEEKKVIEPNVDDPEEEIVHTYKPPNTDTPTKLTRPRRTPGTPISVEVPDNVDKQFTDVSKEFSSTLENYIEASAKCFAEQVIDIQESYLTFVCATTGHSSIRELLEEKFAGEMLCSKMDCDGIQSELMEQMLDHANGKGDPGSVTRKVPGQTQSVSDAQ